MHKSEKENKVIERYHPSFQEGLSHEQVEARNKEGLINRSVPVVGKTLWQIIRDNVLSFFNILLFVIAGFMIYANVADQNPQTKWHRGLFFVLVLLSNIIIGLYQDLRAKSLMKKMKLITAPKVTAIRDDKEETITPEQVVLDDILLFKSSDQIVSDCEVLEGNALVNESLLTGETVNVAKTVGDKILSGTYVVSGHLYAAVEKVGKDNYVETLATKAKAFKRNPSQILRSLKRLFHILGYVVIGFFLVIQIIYAAEGGYSSKMQFINTIHPTASQLVAMIPAGLFLLTSMALASSVISLSKKKANVQELYSVEMLARTDVLCVDKTGTITDGTMKVSDIVPLTGKKNIEEIKEIIASILEATKDNNGTAKALAEICVGKNIEEAKVSLPFNSDNKYSGATFNSGTYLLGASEYLNIENKEEILSKYEKRYDW